MHVLVIILLVLCLVILVVATVFGVIQEMDKYRERRWTARRAIESEWRIHQIKSDARSQMWDEVTRQRESDGGLE